MAGGIICDTINGDNISGGFFGVGQTWQDVTASRVENTTYTNTTGKTIMISVTPIDSRYSTQPNTGSSGVSIYVNGTIVFYGSNTGGAATICVPDNATYKVIGYEVAYDNIYSWWELR